MLLKKPAPVPVDPAVYRGRADEYTLCALKLAGAGIKWETAQLRCLPIFTGQVPPQDEPTKIPWTAIAIGSLVVLGAVGGILVYRRYSRSALAGYDMDGPEPFDDAAVMPPGMQMMGAPLALPEPTFSGRGGSGVPARFKGCICF